MYMYITRCRAVHCFIHVQYVLFHPVLHHNFLKVFTLLLCVIHPFTPSPSPQQAITTPQLLRWLPCHSLYEAGGSPHTTIKVVVSQPLPLQSRRQPPQYNYHGMCCALPLSLPLPLINLLFPLPLPLPSPSSLVPHLLFLELYHSSEAEQHDWCPRLTMHLTTQQNEVAQSTGNETVLTGKRAR